MKKPPVSLTYRDAGVDIDAGDALVERIKPLARRTLRPGADHDLGGFGALFDLKAGAFKDPILVSGTDGVGTKLKIAVEMGVHHTIGQDLVAMNVNDVVTQGARPLFFLDYFATGRLSLDVAEAVIGGIATACEACNVALIGGETTELPGMYHDGEYDLAGFTVGAVERERLLPRLNEIRPGDLLVGLGSSGLHSNGFSLVRKVVETTGLKLNNRSPFSESTLGESLLTPTKLYVLSMLELLNSECAAGVKAAAHITGGGTTGNLPRVLPKGLVAEMDLSTWPASPVFSWLAREGGICPDEMLRTFNCGVGMILVIDPDHLSSTLNTLRAWGEEPFVLGKLVSGETSAEPFVRYHGQMVN